MALPTVMADAGIRASRLSIDWARTYESWVESEGGGVIMSPTKVEEDNMTRSKIGRMWDRLVAWFIEY